MSKRKAEAQIQDTPDQDTNILKKLKHDSQVDNNIQLTPITTYTDYQDETRYTTTILDELNRLTSSAEYLDDQKDGTSNELTYNDSYDKSLPISLLVTEWKHDKKDGTQKEYYEGSLICNREWENNKLINVMCFFSNGGESYYQEFYPNSNTVSLDETVYENGKIKSETTYFPDGAIKTQELYNSNGVLEVFTEYFYNRIMKQRRSYFYDKSSKLEIYTHKGQLYKSTFYNSDGLIIDKEIYNNKCWYHSDNCRCSNSILSKYTGTPDGKSNLKIYWSKSGELRMENCKDGDKLICCNKYSPTSTLKESYTWTPKDGSVSKQFYNNGSLKLYRVFDADGNFESSTTYFNNNNNNTRSTQYYNEDGNYVIKAWYSNKKLKREEVYTKLNQIVSAYNYDKYGILIESDSEEYSESDSDTPQISGPCGFIW